MGNRRKSNRRLGRGSHSKKTSLGTVFPVLRSYWSISKINLICEKFWQCLKIERVKVDQLKKRKLEKEESEDEAEDKAEYIQQLDMILSILLLAIIYQIKEGIHIDDQGSSE